MSRNGVALLPATSCLFNANKIPLSRLNEVWYKNTVYVGRNDQDKVVFFVSSGRLSNKFKVGTNHRIQHDQTGASYGYYEIVNIIDVENGQVINKENHLYLSSKAPVWVFK